ncbi:hypothetical protein DACRYDRAFT_103786 [Dacryopinax primogenitus]|uniref:FBD domain-containing protein n=1 Tax=Dacryopinax primogenitus (strain DJM 731) TaxID=1858805 RepID=M5GEC6_DACPD|nr:uncharacterized protein DACRYDRAFT_103786 [Dacryopinax primogenitus]EJU05292.1 hypothetical protein DACRYDRAFT_103786 [Dacryopinax primogenitus]
MAQATRLRSFTFRTIPSERDTLELNYLHLARLAEAASNLQSITVVNLSMKSQLPDDAQFPEMGQLKSLILHDVDFGDAVLKTILRSTPKLEELQVGFILFGSYTDTGFAEALSYVSNTLVSLRIQRVGRRSHVEGYELETLLPKFTRLRSFTYLQKQWDSPMFYGPS